MLQSSSKLPGKAVPSRQGSNLGPNAQQSKVGTRISMGKAGSIACLEELEEAGKKKQMAEWSSDRYAARQARTSLGQALTYLSTFRCMASGYPMTKCGFQNLHPIS